MVVEKILPKRMCFICKRWRELEASFFLSSKLEMVRGV